MSPDWAAAFANLVYMLLQTKLVAYGVVGLLIVLFSVKLWKRFFGINANCSCGYKKDERIG